MKGFNPRLTHQHALHGNPSTFSPRKSDFHEPEPDFSGDAGSEAETFDDEPLRKGRSVLGTLDFVKPQQKTSVPEAIAGLSHQN